MITEHESRAVLARHGLERNSKPCGTCAHFEPIAGVVALCAKKRVQVSSHLCIIRKTGEDCWASQKGR